MLIRYKNYDKEVINDMLMGPSALLLTEELTSDMKLKSGMTVLDLGCGKALSSVFLAKEFGVTVYSVDPQVSASENHKKMKELSVDQLVFPIQADAMTLPFKHETFDAIICINAYHNFGTDPSYFSKRLGPFLKPGGQVGIVVSCLSATGQNLISKDVNTFLEAGNLPAFLKATQWCEIMKEAKELKINICEEMKCTFDAWRDWLIVNNPIANDAPSARYEINPKVGFVKIIATKKSKRTITKTNR